MLRLFGVSTILAGVAFAQAAPSVGGLVTGAPYSADEIFEMTAPASGGQVAPSIPVGHVYRDSAGRTRTERPALTGPAAQTGNLTEVPMIIEINDPVAGVRYTLDAQNKVAHKQLIPSLAKSADPRMAAILGPVPNMTPPPPPGGMGAPSQAGMSTGPNGMPAGRLAQPESKTEKLGTQTIEGVSAEGTRQTTTLPAGLTGGNGPAVTVSETWFSPELKVTMLSKENDPRLGERTTKLVNVNRSEPSATLFAPAADYKVVEERPGAMIQPGQRK